MAPFIEDVRVDHGRADVLVSKQFLDRSDVVAGLKQVCGKGMPERMASHALDEVCLAHRFLYCPLENCLVDVVPSLFAGLGILPAVLLRENPLPTPLLRRIGVFSFDGVG